MSLLSVLIGYCDKLDDLESVCSDITHDFRLHTIVKGKKLTIHFSNLSIPLWMELTFLSLLLFPLV